MSKESPWLDAPVANDDAAPWKSAPKAEDKPWLSAPVISDNSQEIPSSQESTQSASELADVRRAEMLQMERQDAPLFGIKPGQKKLSNEQYAQLFEYQGQDKTPSIAEPILKDVIPRPKGDSFGAGLVRGGADLLEGLTSPENIGLIASGVGAPEAIAKLTSTAFSGLMAKGAGESAIETYKALKEGRMGEAGQAAASTIGSTLMARSALKHGMEEKTATGEVIKRMTPEQRSDFVANREPLVVPPAPIPKVTYTGTEPLHPSDALVSTERRVSGPVDKPQVTTTHTFETSDPTTIEALKVRDAGAPATADAILKTSAPSPIVPSSEGTQMPGFMRKPITPENVVTQPNAVAPSAIAGEGVAAPVKMIAAAYETPDGKRFTGIDHMDANMKADEAGVKIDDSMAGFIGENGKFYNREAAYKAAKGQLDNSADTFAEGQLHTGKLIEPFDDLADTIGKTAPEPLPPAQSSVSKITPRIAEGKTTDDIVSDAMDAAPATEQSSAGTPSAAWEHLQKQIDHPRTSEIDRGKMRAAQRVIENRLEDQNKQSVVEGAKSDLAGTDELLSTIENMGGFPKTHPVYGDAMTRIASAAKEAKRKKLVRENAPGDFDQMRGDLKARGFNFETPEDLFNAVEDSLRTGKEVRGTIFPEDYKGGPGAMGPVEKEQMEIIAKAKATSNKEAIVNQELAAEGYDPVSKEEKISNIETLDRAEAILEKNPARGDEIVARLTTENPHERTISLEDGGVMLYERKTLQNQREAAAERAVDPELSPQERDDARRTYSAIDEKIHKMNEAAQGARSTWGRFGQFWQQMLRDDYTFDTLRQKDEVLKGRRLTEDETAAIKKTADEIAKAQKDADFEVEEQTKRNEDADLDAKIAAYEKARQAESETQSPYSKAVLDWAERMATAADKKRDAAIEFLKKDGFFGSESGSTGGVGGPAGEGKKMGQANRAQEMSRIKALSDIITAHIIRFGANRAKNLEAILTRYPNAGPYFDKAYKLAVKAHDKLTNGKPSKVKAAITDIEGTREAGVKKKTPKSKDTLVGQGKADIEAGDGLSHKTVAEIVNGFIDAGIRDRDELFKKSHEVVKEFMPEATERDVRRAYIEYGKKTFPNPDEIATFRRNVRQAAKIEEDIARLEKDKLRPEKQGYQRDKINGEISRLQKERSELLKNSDLPPDLGSFATKDEAKQTRIINRMNAIDEELRGIRKINEGTPTAADSIKTEQLRAEKDAMEEKLKEVRAAENPPLSPAQKALDSALVARERAAQTLDDIASGKLKPDSKGYKEALTQLEEDVRMETDSMKQLVAEMRRDAKPKGDPGYLKEQAQIKRLEDAIERYREKTANKDYSVKGKQLGPDSRKVTDLKDVLASRRSMYEIARDVGKEVLTPEQRYNKATLKALEKREADLKERVKNKDYAPRPKPVPKKVNDAVMAAQARVEAIKLDFMRGQERERLRKRTTTEKTLEGISKWRRAFILSGVHTIAKLASAAGEIMAIAPVENAVGGVLGKVPGLRRVADMAPRHSSFSMHAEREALVGTIRHLFKDTKDYFKTGHTDLDLVYGKKDVAPPSFLDYVGRIHGALKTPARRNEFIRSLSNRMDKAKLKGVDTSDPMVQTKLMMDAYKDANAAIFMEDNRVVNGYKAMMARLVAPDKVTGKTPSIAKAAEAAVKWTMPIVRIPTNIVARTFEYSLGSLTGSARLARALATGVEKLHPEEADVIMRNLKRGSVGLAVMALGYFNPDSVGGYYDPEHKKKPGDIGYGSIKVHGVEIPKFLIHNPLMEQLQIGASIRKMVDAKVKGTDSEKQKIGMAILETGVDVLKETPFTREIQDIGSLLDKNKRAAVIGNQVKGVVPVAVQELAKATDRSNGKPVARKPKTVVEHVKTAIPGLRQTVPARR